MRRHMTDLLFAGGLCLAIALIGGWLTTGTTLYRTGQVLGPLILGGLAWLWLRKGMSITGMVFLFGSVVAGAYGLRDEWTRLSLAQIPLLTMPAAMDVPLVLVSTVALLMPAAPWLMRLSVPVPIGQRPAAKRRIFGSARWMTLSEAMQRFHDGSLVIGAAYDPNLTRVPEVQQRAPLLTFKGNGHLLTVGGSGSGKTRTIVGPNCRYWRGPMVVLDPKGDLGTNYGGIRQRLGHQVLILNPHDPNSDAINVLDWLDPANPAMVMDAKAVVSWMIDGQAKDSNEVFVDRARALLEAVLIDMLCDPDLPPTQKTLRGLYARLQGSALATTISVLEGREPAYAWGIPHNVGREMNDLQSSVETWQGVAIYLAKAIDFLKADGAARMLSGEGRNTMPTRALCDGNVDVFIAVPLKSLMSTPAIARLALGALLNAVYQQEGQAAKQEVLFLLDEMPRLGPMALLETARDAGRSAGIRLWGIIQDFGQLKKAYGEHGFTSWIASSTVQTFIGINDLETAKWLSESIGQIDTTVESHGRNSSRGALSGLTTQRGHNTSTSVTGSPLITPSEIMRMHTDAEGNADEHIVLVRQMDPLRCGVVRAESHHGLLS